MTLSHSVVFAVCYSLVGLRLRLSSLLLMRVIYNPSSDGRRFCTCLWAHIYRLSDGMEVLGHRVWLCLVLVDITATPFSEVLLLSDTPTGAVSEFWVAPVFANPCLFNISLSSECVLVCITL